MGILGGMLHRIECMGSMDEHGGHGVEVEAGGGIDDSGESSGGRVRVQGWAARSAKM